MKTGVPEGFVTVRPGGEFIAVNGPLYINDEPGRFRLGFRVETRHANPLGSLHGGMMASFCDMLLPMAAHRCAEVGMRFLPTISLQIDYLASVAVGAWVEGEAQLLRSTRTMVFMQGLVRSDGKPAARASGIFKLGPALEARREAVL